MFTTLEQKTTKAEPKRKQKAAKSSLAKAVAECLSQANNITIKAAQLLQIRVNEDPRLMQELITPPVLYQLCYVEVSNAIRSERREIWSTPNYTKSSKRERIAALVSSNLMMYPLSTGKHLGDATKADIIVAIEIRRKQAHTLEWHARWLERIAAELTGRQKVRSVFTEERLQQLQQEVSHVQ